MTYQQRKKRKGTKKQKKNIHRNWRKVMKKIYTEQLITIFTMNSAFVTGVFIEFEKEKILC